MEIKSNILAGVDPGFFVLGGGGWRVGGCYLGVAESMKHAPRMFQFKNLNVTIMWRLSRVFWGRGLLFQGVMSFGILWCC